MASWEYKQINIKTKGGILRDIKATEDYILELNNAGRDGWELVAAVPLTESHGRIGAIEFVFKRGR